MTKQVGLSSNEDLPSNCQVAGAGNEQHEF